MSDDQELLLQRSRSLRKEMTPQERRLWYQFLRSYPVRFRRQKVIGRYIVDFYCHQARLVIELDGSQHYSPEEMAYDASSSKNLEAQGLQVIRYANNQIDGAFQAVCQEIDWTVQKKLTTDSR